MNFEAIGFNVIPRESTVKAKVQKTKLNFNMLNGVASVKRVSASKYKIRMLNLPSNVKKITSMIKAFNDIEIAYSPDLGTSDLIKKSKKPLWKLTQADDGSFILEKSVK